MKESVICFAVGNIDYLDPITIAINSFVEYNKDIKFNTKSDMHLDNPIMIHYVGSKKPFEIKEQDSPVAVFNICQYYRWYEYYDTVKQYFSDKFNSQVANVRQKINSKEFKIFDQFSIQGKLYGIYRDKALPVITSYC